MGYCKIGEELIVDILDFGMGGEGIAKIDNYPIFIQGAIKGEQVKIKLSYVKKDYAFGDIVEVIKSSDFRVKPKCPYYGKCGGCDMQHIAYPEQLEIKRLNIQRTLKKNAGIDMDVPAPISVNEWEYRNKLALPFGKRGDRVVLGFYEKQTHKVVSMKFCPLHKNWAADVIRVFSEWANENKISVYDEITKKGFLRHLVVRFIDTPDVILVGAGDKIPFLDLLVAKIKEVFSTFSLYFSPNKKTGNVILGDTEQLVYGEETSHNIDGIDVKINPFSFLQVNLDAMSILYNKVAEELSNFDGDIVELYSGIGILTANLAKRMPKSKFVAVEIVLEAVQDARALMESLDVSNRVRCICDDAGKFMDELIDDNNKKALLIDPPRKGIDEKVVFKAKEVKFDKIVYISCNPATLSRDIKMLSDSYEIAYIQPFDMFPQTTHVETVVVLNRK